jgi:hypothetical protein
MQGSFGKECGRCKSPEFPRDEENHRYYSRDAGRLAGIAFSDIRHKSSLHSSARILSLIESIKGSGSLTKPGKVLGLLGLILN